jgi:hypothetical protein
MLYRRISVALLVLLGLGGYAGGADSETAEESPASRPTVNAALEAARARYGTEAAALQGYLLNYAIRGGSVLDASVSIAGIESRHERDYLVFKLETGIIYQEGAVSPPLRLARIWSDVVEPSLRRAAQMDLSANGIGFRVTYRSGPYTERADIQRQLRAQRIRAEEASFYVSTGDVIELIAEEITAQELADRAEVQVDGKPARVDLSVLPNEAADAEE